MGGSLRTVGRAIVRKIKTSYMSFGSNDLRKPALPGLLRVRKRGYKIFSARGMGPNGTRLWRDQFENRQLQFPANREAVVFRSPGSRSAPWVANRTTKLHREAVPLIVAPLRGAGNKMSARKPRVRCATLGFGVEPLRG